MTLQPYDYYAEVGDQKAYSRWNASMKYFVGGCGIVGALIGLAVAKTGGAVIGAFAGGVIGYGIFRAIVYSSSENTADELYRFDWCQARGMTYKGDDYFPADAPYAHRGDKQKATDAYEGEWNGLQTLFYNFTYTEKGDSDDPDTDYDFKIMRLSGRELPIERLTMHQRGFMNKFKWVDSLQGALTKEKPISLESAAFNEKFDLTIDDKADEIWIRRIFDPATIQMLVDGSFTIPDLRYYDWSWWFVDREHFKTSELEQWVTRQQTAAKAVELLSRVQNL